MNQVKHLLSTAILAAVALCAVPAGATVILTMGQQLTGSPIVGTETAGTSTTITGTNIPITVTQFVLGSPATPFHAFLDLNAKSVGSATTVLSQVVQDFSGTFSITSGSGDTGTNYLSGSFTDAVFGSGASLTLSVAQPPNSATFTSSVIPAGDLGLARGISLSFADVSAPVHITGTTLGSFTSSVSGTFSANVGSHVPEPGSLALVGLAMLGMVVLMRSRSRR